MSTLLALAHSPLHACDELPGELHWVPVRPSLAAHGGGEPAAPRLAERLPGASLTHRRVTPSCPPPAPEQAAQ